MEILAPAGSEASLKAAVACGADAVYLGTKDFNARSKADNFSDEQLRLAVSYCHDRGVRVYITLNTLVKDTEIEAAVTVVEKASAAGADAFLIQDLGLYQLLRKRFPEVSFHTSTQMGVHNLPGAIMAEKLGFDRVVLSRETLLADIRAIKQNTGLEIEFFVHGAHCVSFSGNCYFSAMVSGFSGNRGKCLQLCRKKYEISDGSKRTVGYLFSAKDICLLSEIRRLAEAGVDSLKIEGRLRSPEYVGTVTDVYKRALIGKTAVGDADKLKTVFNRGNFSCAYIKEDRPDIIYPVQQNHIGVKVGTVAATAGNSLILDSKYCICNGDGFKILRGGKEVGSGHASGGKLRFNGMINKGDAVCLTKSGELERELAIKVACDANTKKIEITKLSANNHSTMSDIVTIKYSLPFKCRILQTDENCSARLRSFCDLIILSPTRYDAGVIANFVKNRNVPVLLDMPVEARGRDVGVLAELIKADLVDGYVANNIYALEMCKEKPVLLGQGMNSISSLLDAPKIMSQEAAYADKNAAIYAFGRATLMHLTHCPKRQMGCSCKDCRKCSDVLKLRDERKNTFLLRRHTEYYCYWELINGMITNLFPKLDKHKNTRFIVDARSIDPELAEAALTQSYGLAFDVRTHTYGRFGKGVK